MVSVQNGEHNSTIGFTVSACATSLQAFPSKILTSIFFFLPRYYLVHWLLKRSWPSHFLTYQLVWHLTDQTENSIDTVLYRFMGQHWPWLQWSSAVRSQCWINDLPLVLVFIRAINVILWPVFACNAKNYQDDSKWKH